MRISSAILANSFLISESAWFEYDLDPPPDEIEALDADMKTSSYRAFLMRYSLRKDSRAISNRFCAFVSMAQ